MCADEQLARAARGIDGDRGDRVEPEQREIGEIVARQRFAAQVGVNEPQAAEPAVAAADTAEVGQHDLRGVADDHVLDRAAAIDQHADLAMQLRRLCRELRRELRRDDLGRSDATAVQPLQRLDLARLETLSIARYLFSVALVVRNLPVAAAGCHGYSRAL